MLVNLHHQALDFSGQEHWLLCITSREEFSPGSQSWGWSGHRGGSLYARAWLYEWVAPPRLIQINHSWCWKFTFEKGCSQVPWTQLSKEGKAVKCLIVVMGVVGGVICYMNLNCQCMHFHPERIQLINYVLFIWEPLERKQNKIGSAGQRERTRIK